MDANSILENLVLKLKMSQLSEIHNEIFGGTFPMPTAKKRVLASWSSVPLTKILYLSRREKDKENGRVFVDCFCGNQSRAPFLVCNKCGSNYHSTCVGAFRFETNSFCCPICLFAIMDPFHTSRCWSLNLPYPLSPALSKQQQQKLNKNKNNNNGNELNDGFGIRLIGIQMPLVGLNPKNVIMDQFVISKQHFAQLYCDEKKIKRPILAVRCFSGGYPVGLPKEIKQISINGESIKRKKGSQPMDITAFIKVGDNLLVVELEQKFAIESTALPCLIQIDLLDASTPESVIEKIKKGNFRKLLTLEECKIISKNICDKQLNELNDESIIVSEQKRFISQQEITISLRCVISMMRIKTPIRSINCSHFQCFDLESFISTSYRSLKWKCPICDSKSHIEDIFIDSYFQSLLLNTNENCDDLVLEKNNFVWKEFDVNVSENSAKRSRSNPEATEIGSPQTKILSNINIDNIPPLPTQLETPLSFPSSYSSSSSSSSSTTTYSSSSSSSSSLSSTPLSQSPTQKNSSSSTTTATITRLSYGSVLDPIVLE